MTVILSQSQAALLNCMKSENITAQGRGATIYDLSVWCNLTYSTAVNAIYKLLGMGILSKHRPPGYKSYTVYWLEIPDVEYEVRACRGRPREIDMPRTWQEFAAMEW